MFNKLPNYNNYSNNILKLQKFYNKMAKMAFLMHYLQ